MADLAAALTYGKHGVDDGGLREDVIDIMFQITPEATPLYNAIGDSQANGTRHQWTTRALDPRATNKVQEGAVWGTYNTAKIGTRRTNYTQIFQKLPQVSRSAQSSAVVAISDLMADQIEMRMTEAKGDMELALINGTGTSATADSATARGLNGIKLASTADHGGSNYFTYGSTGSFSETMFTDLLEQVWTDGANPMDCISGAKIKRKIGQFTGGATKNFLSADKRVISIVNIIETDFGVVTAQISRDVSSTADGPPFYDVIVFDRNMLKKAWLDSPFVQDIPGIGDSRQAAVMAEMTLEFGHADAIGVLNKVNFHGVT